MSSARLDGAFTAIARSDDVTVSSPVPISVVEDRTAPGEEPAAGVMGLITLLPAGVLLLQLDTVRGRQLCST